MFAKLAIFTAVFAVAALAIPAPQTIASCNTGVMQCCNELHENDSPTANALTGLLGLATGGLTGQVGVTCSPISAVAIAGNSCSTQPVCCDHNQFNGLVNAGCTPINANL